MSNHHHTVQTTLAPGEMVIFFDYIEAMRPEDRVFGPGQYVRIRSINEDGGLQCVPVDFRGQLTGKDGDTVFPEEVIALPWRT